MHFFLFFYLYINIFLYIDIYFTLFVVAFLFFLYWEIKLNIISLNHKLVRRPSLERDRSSGDHVPIPGWVAPQIFIHPITVVLGSPTQQQTSLTTPAGMVYTFSFSFVWVCLVIIDPVQQRDAQLSHPLCQVSAVTVWCSGLAILSVVMYLMVWWFALNHAGTTTVPILGCTRTSLYPVSRVYTTRSTLDSALLCISEIPLRILIL